MIINELCYQRQPQAFPSLLVRNEGVKEARAQAIRHARPIIPDFDYQGQVDETRTGSIRETNPLPIARRKHDLGIWRFGHCLDRVLQQVQYHLNQKITIAEDWRQS